MTEDSPTYQDLISMRPTTRYRAFLLGPCGRILREIPITASDDDHALLIVRRWGEGRPIDLWDGLRFIEHLPATAFDDGM